MKKTILRIAAAMLGASSLTTNAWAGCVSPADMAALKTAAMQQELMVAAFSCHDIDLYNHFVRSHQPELIQSDAQLKAYFVQRDGGRRGEASYHTYKTELANASSLNSLHDDGFCDRVADEFESASDQTSLASTLDERRWGIEGTYHACDDSGALLATANEGPPARTRLTDSDDSGNTTGTLGRSRMKERGRAWHGSGDVRGPSPHGHLESL